MNKRVVLGKSFTPDGEPLELAVELGHHVIRVGQTPLMSSSMRGSEEAMAEVALAELGEPDAPRVLVGGLGMGFTLRAALDAFGDDAQVCVAELLPAIIRFNRDHLADLADRPLEDPRVEVFEGDVMKMIDRGDWDVILMDVDNGPEPLTSSSNKRFYDARGADRLARALAPGGVLVVWSAYQSQRFLERLRKTGLTSRTITVRGRWPLRKGPIHTLFVATN